MVVESGWGMQAVVHGSHQKRDGRHYKQKGKGSEMAAQQYQSLNWTGILKNKQKCWTIVIISFFFLSTKLSERLFFVKRVKEHSDFMW